MTMNEIAHDISEWYPPECVSHTPIKLDDLMAGETDCEGCDTWICKECGQDVEAPCAWDSNPVYDNGVCRQCYDSIVESEAGTCDTCGVIYDVSSRAGRCGDCGNCASHCEHGKGE